MGGTQRGERSKGPERAGRGYSKRTKAGEERETRHFRAGPVEKCPARTRTGLLRWIRGSVLVC
jgi:hypothetical protein